MKSSVIARTSDLEIARRFTEHQKQLAKCAGNEYCNEDRSGLIQLMAVLYGETQGLRRPQQLLQACLQLQERRGLKPQTMLNYLAIFSNFVDYCFLYSDGVSNRMEREHSTMLAAIKSVRKAFSTAAIKNYRTTAKQLRARVPSIALVRNHQKLALSHLKDNLATSTLTYKQQQALNFFVLQGRLNVRSGPLLALTWEDVKYIEENSVLETDRHKTGKFYTLYLKIKADQIPLLYKLKETFADENDSMESKYVFSSKQNKIERSISKHIQEFFFTLFGDDPNEVRFNANSIRKYCERRWKSFIGKVPEGVTKAHLAQTAHNKTTAEDIYIGREGTSEDRDQLLSIYCDDLSSDIPPEEAEEAEEAEVDDKESDVESDFEAPEEPHPIDPQTPMETPICSEPIVRRFNAIRPSVNLTPINPVTPTEQPAAIVTREQTVTADARRRSTIGQSSEDVLREKFIKSLKSFRVKLGAPAWTDPEKKACLLFSGVSSTVSVPDIKARCEEAGIRLSNDAHLRIYTKLKSAVQVFKHR